MVIGTLAGWTDGQKDGRTVVYQAPEEENPLLATSQ